MHSHKNKKNLKYILPGLFLIFVCGFIFLDTTIVSAQSQAQADAARAMQAGEGGGGGNNFLVLAFKELLLGVLSFISVFVNVGASVFAWATRPEYISGPGGLLNLQIVYTLWGVVRDFFNLAFIFLLLFSAFATVFQVERFGIKKNFFKIVGAAIIINFSFPIARLIIDFGNVPMYFFAQGLMNANESGGNSLTAIPSAFFQTARVAEVGNYLPTNAGDSSVFSIISAIIFQFIFAITLFVLAILFVIRLLMLVVLLILSPLGLAASIIPGIQNWGKQWWSRLLKTVFFGPAAMFMIVLGLNFTQALNNSDFVRQISATAPAVDAQSTSSILAYGLFFIPIIFMWMAMTMGSKFGIEGSNAVISRGIAVANWGRRMALAPVGATWKGTKAVGRGAASPVTNRFRGLKAGLKSRYDDKIGEPLKKRAESVEARAKARTTGLLTREKGSYKKALDKADKKVLNSRANEKLKKDREENIGPLELLNRFKKNSKGGYDSSDAERLAAAKNLINDKEALKNATPEQLEGILEVANIAGNKDVTDKALKNAGSSTVKLDNATIDRMKQGYAEAHGKDAATKAILEAEFQENLKDKLEKEGRMQVFIDYEVATTGKSYAAAYDDNIGSFKAKQIGQLKDVIITSSAGVKSIRPDFEAFVRDKKNNAWSPKDMQDFYAELSSDDKKVFKAASLAP